MARAFMIKDIQPLMDKVGEDDQRWGGSEKTLLGYANAAYQHIHMPGYIWPYDCSVVNAVTSATANTFGDFVELVPAGGIVAPYDCHWVTVTNISAEGVYLVEFYVVSDDDLQAPEIYLTAFSVSRVSNFDRSAQVNVQMPAIGGGLRIGARAKKSGAGAGTVSFNIHYHEYE